MMQLQLE